MVKTHHFQVTVQEYYARGKDNLFPDLYGCPNVLCHNEGRLRKHGFYSRNILTLFDSCIIFIQRYYCPACKKTTSLLPSFVSPRFQYSLGCIFYVLGQLIIHNLPLAGIAERVNLCSKRSEMSHQHLSFYRKRLFTNKALITGFFGSKGIVLAEPSSPLWAQDFINQAYQAFGLPDFNAKYFSFQARGFLSKC